MAAASRLDATPSIPKTCQACAVLQRTRKLRSQPRQPTNSPHPGSGNEALTFHRLYFHFHLGGCLSSRHPGAEIVQKALDEFVIYNLPIAFKSGNTTVLFPSAISGLYAKSIAVQEQPNADFLISFTPGNYYFTVRALKPRPKTISLSSTTGRRTCFI